jgi:hypothetical protein
MDATMGRSVFLACFSLMRFSIAGSREKYPRRTERYPNATFF